MLSSLLRSWSESESESHSFQWIGRFDHDSCAFRGLIKRNLNILLSFLPHRCDECSERFAVEHAMSCKKGGLVVQRHNDVAAEWYHLCVQALQPSAVSDEPLRYTGRGVQTAGATGVEAAADTRADVAFHGFWRRAAPRQSSTFESQTPMRPHTVATIQSKSCEGTSRKR